jgi:hypothetical protein
MVAGLAGCGSDKSGNDAGGADTVAGTESSTTAAPTPSASTETPTETTPGSTTATEPPPGAGTSTSPEDQPGGAGDEEPARTEVTIVADVGGKGPRPRRANVAPYIAVRVIFVVKYDVAHTLEIGGKKVSTVGGKDVIDLDGLPPGKSYRGLVDGRIPIKIVSASEPGP